MISKQAEKLLKGTIKNQDNIAKYLRSQCPEGKWNPTLKELVDGDFAQIIWAGDLPHIAKLTPKGKEYARHKKWIK